MDDTTKHINLGAKLLDTLLHGTKRIVIDHEDMGGHLFYNHRHDQELALQYYPSPKHLYVNIGLWDAFTQYFPISQELFEAVVMAWYENRYDGEVTSIKYMGQ